MKKVSICAVLMTICMIIAAVPAFAESTADRYGTPDKTIVTAPRFTATEGKGPVIKTQPEDVTVSYPEGASFHVEVEDPDNVASYQWIMHDKVDNEFILSGITAKTDTVVIPSTVREHGILRFSCVVTDKEGNVTISDEGSLDIDNRDVIKPVFYVGEYAVEPGEKLDLETVDIGGGHKLGKGSVEFDSNGTDITLTDLDYDNTYVTCDLAATSNVALSMEYYMPDEEEYNVYFVGNNRIYNSYYDYDYNVGGIPFDFYFIGEGDKPLVNFKGNGSLEITNGSIALRVIGDLMVDIDITLKQDKKLYADGISANNLMIAQGNNINMEVYGSALYATGNIYVYGAKLDIDANAPHISQGVAVKRLIQAGGMVNIESSTVDIDATVDPEVCEMAGGYTAVQSGSDLFITDTKLDYDLNVIPKKSGELYASSFIGLTGAYTEIDSSFVTINMKDDDVYSAFGIYADEHVQIKNNSIVNVDVLSSGQAYGIAAEGDFNAEESNINVKAQSSPKYGDNAAYGIMCENFAVKETKDDLFVKVLAKDGMAVGCNTGDVQYDEPAAYTEGYEAHNVYMRDNTACLEPAHTEINLGNVELNDGEKPYYIYVETFYDSDDTSEPLSELVFGYKSVSYEPVYEKDADCLTWLKGSEEDLVLTVKRSSDDSDTLKHFDHIEFDGKELDKDSYKAEAGSLKVTFTTEALDKLEKGSHKITVVFDDGEAEVLLKVKEEIVITVTGASKTVSYDGKEQSVTGFMAESKDKSFDVKDLSISDEKKASASGTNAGVYKMGLKEEDFTYTHDEYTIPAIKVTDGILTIAKAKLTITTGSATKIYDAKALTNTDVKVEGLAEGEKITVKTTGTRTLTGSTDNTYSIDWGDVNKDNYEIVEKLGKLTITSSSGSSSDTSGSSSSGKSATTIPKTGDDSHVMLWISLMALAGMLAAAAVISGGVLKKKKNNR